MMNSVHRQLARFGGSKSADESQVAALLKDFNDADEALAKIIEASKAWRDSWVSILTTQQSIVKEFEAMYRPVVAVGEYARRPAETPQETMERTSKLCEAYEELRVDLLEEVNLVDGRIVKPAMQARDHLGPLKKVIKKRENTKADYDRYQSRVDSYRKKTKRSDREQGVLEKAEADLAKATEEYQAADGNLREHLPNLLASTYSLLPHLLAAQIMTQNSLLAQYYTTLHNYCQNFQYPSPAPPVTEILRSWETDFTPLQQEVETALNCIANGKAVQRPINMEEQRTTSNSRFRPSLGTLGRRGSSQQSPSLLRTSSGNPLSPGETGRSRIPSMPSSPGPNASPAITEHRSPGISSGASDYFSRERTPSVSSASNSLSVAAAGKRPPPPPPPKRLPSAQSQWVTALYSFDGQNAGDLAFREGDRIRVVRKTESSDDWWEGELRGVKGAFPANYCQVG